MCPPTTTSGPNSWLIGSTRSAPVRLSVLRRVLRVSSAMRVTMGWMLSLVARRRRVGGVGGYLGSSGDGDGVLGVIECDIIDDFEAGDGS